MYSFLSKHKFLALLLSVVATVAIAAGYERISKDKLILGTGTGTSTVFESDLGLGSANPKIRFNTSAPEIEFAKDGVTYESMGSGGGGGSLVWKEIAGIAPLRIEELSQTVFLFDTLSGTTSYVLFSLGS